MCGFGRNFCQGSAVPEINDGSNEILVMKTTAKGFLSLRMAVFTPILELASGNAGGISCKFGCVLEIEGTKWHRDVYDH